jgi:hypothetical protein
MAHSECGALSQDGEESVVGPALEGRLSGQPVTARMLSPLQAAPPLAAQAASVPQLQMSSRVHSLCTMESR